MTRFPRADVRGPWTLVLAFVLLIAVGVLDYLSRLHLALSAFYLVPVCWVGWARGRKTGIIFATLSVAVWLTADLMTTHIYPHPAIPYWNAFTLLALFVVVVHLMCSVQSANKNLEDTVQQRTAALRAEIAERKRLENAKLQAERLAMVGSIAAQVAHEVRNPLGSIKLNLDLISKEIQGLAGTSRYSPQEADVLVAEMREEVRRIQRVIEDYLRFARLPKLQRKPLNLNELLEQKLAFMEATFEKAGVRVRTDFDSDLGAINADPEQLWQACLNLLQNSLDAMPTGGSLAVTTRRENGQALLCVADSGNGMTEQQQRQLFVPFFTTKKGGTGLGLPLTQRILNEHGAQIECASAVGNGTSFTIRFPLSSPS